MPPAPTYQTTAIRAHRYDGTIRSAVWHTPAAPTLHGVAYVYDDKGQFTQSIYGEQLGGIGRAFVPSAADSYAEKGLTYNLNGNITALQRTDGVGFTTAKYRYTYEQNSNRLLRLTKPLVKQPYPA